MPGYPHMGSRLCVQDDGATLRITVGPRWYYPRTLVAVVTGWMALGGLLLVGMIVAFLVLSNVANTTYGFELEDNPAGPFIYVILGAFALVGVDLAVGFIALLIMTIRGREEITVGQGLLSIQWRPVGRQRAYALQDVSNIREELYVPRLARRRPRGTHWFWWAGNIAFEAGGKTVWFGHSLSQEEIDEILAALRSRLPAKQSG